MVIEKIHVNNSTSLTLSDRFTILQGVQPPLPPRRALAQPDIFRPPATRSSRLMGRLGVTPMARASSQMKKTLQQRIGKPIIRVPNSKNLISNGASLFSPGKGRLSFTSPNRGRRKSYTFGSHNRSFPHNDASPGNNDRGFRRQRLSFRGRRGFRTAYGRGGGRGNMDRGRGRGRGGGRGSRNRSNIPPPNKEDLDRELDQYMASSKAHLDKELDSYMINSMDVSY